MSPDDRAVVAAAGGIPWRVVDGVTEVLLVHRSRYLDWSLPKGKLDPGESFSDAAVREVREETGVECVLGEELGSISYEFAKAKKLSNRSKLISKAVRYWEMTPLDPAQSVAPEDPEEITEAAWVAIDLAADKLTHEGDRQILSALVELLAV